MTGWCAWPVAGTPPSPQRPRGCSQKEPATCTPSNTTVALTGAPARPRWDISTEILKGPRRLIDVYGESLYTTLAYLASRRGDDQTGIITLMVAVGARLWLNDHGCACGQHYTPDAGPIGLPTELDTPLVIRPARTAQPLAASTTLATQVAVMIGGPSSHTERSVAVGV